MGPIFVKILLDFTEKLGKIQCRNDESAACVISLVMILSHCSVFHRQLLVDLK